MVMHSNPNTGDDRLDKPSQAPLTRTSPIDPDLLGRATSAIYAARRILVTSHWRPDGDALGCVVALREALRGLGKEVLAGVPDDVPGRYSFMAAAEPLPNLARQADLTHAFIPDLVIIADTSAKAQVEPIWPLLQDCPALRLIVDHHVTHDIPAATELYDTTAGATGLILFDWFTAAGWQINPAAAEALFVAIATDTGWFRFANADARLYHAAARLIECYAVQPSVLYQKLYMNESPNRMKLLAGMLGSLEMHAADHFAICAITRDMFARSGAQYWETEDLINEPMRIGPVRVTVLLIEEPDGKVRMSLRSKDAVDVAAIAQQFGGGGHQRAAGARTPGPLDTTKAQVIAAVLKKLG
jgi:phosphoesterase RecJ-like protein